MSPGARARTAAAAASGAGAAWALRRRVPGSAAWERVNHRGASLTLLEGPAAVAGALAGVALAPLPVRVRAAAAVAVLGGGALGAWDDLAEGRDASGPPSKGLRGHLGALARGRLTTGGLKVLGIGASGLLASAAVVGPRPDGAGRLAHAGAVLAGGALVAGSANLLNLLDLRPGRALKAALVAGAATGPLGAAAAGASAALLPVDLGERGMLGDTGANALGGLLGTAVLARAGRRGRTAALVVVVALTLASERVSFTRVIEATPGLRELDRLGRRA